MVMPWAHGRKHTITETRWIVDDDGTELDVPKATFQTRLDSTIVFRGSSYRVNDIVQRLEEGGQQNTVHITMHVSRT